MIGYLQGRPLRFYPDHFILLVQGVGYEVYASSQTLTDLEGRDFVEVWVHTHVREDVLQLFGFSAEVERSLFLSLLKVNGVGPKSAIQILSGAKTEQILGWIEDANAQALAKLPKLGKKTAEQIVLSLRGKLVREESGSSSHFSARSQIVSALVNLGFRLGDVERVVGQMPPETDFASGVRLGLSGLTA
ncbi:MAG: Holliday junction branch migration protein RuvA [Bdellovibrionales bacterium]